MDFRAAIENIKATVASGKDAAYQKALGLNRNAPPLPEGSAVGEFGQDNVIGLPFGMQLTPELRQQLKAYEDAGYTLQYREPAKKSDDFLSQLDKDLGLSKNAPLIAAATAAYFSSGAVGGETLAGAGATDLAAYDAAAGLTAGGAGAGTAAGIGAGVTAADLAAYDAGAGLTAGGTAAGTNALAGTAANTNALAAETAANSAAGETLAGAGTDAGTGALASQMAAEGSSAVPLAGAGAGAAAAGAMPSWMAPAASVGSALIGAAAAQSAAKTQADAAAQANQLLAQQYQQQRADLAPFTAAGVGAQNQLLTYLGLPGGTAGADYGKYTKDFTGADFLAGQDPGYAFRLSEGQKALERSAAARGGLLSGGTGKALTSYGQQMGSQEYQNAYNRYQTNRANQLAPLFSLTGSGQAAAANQAAAAGNYATGAANNLTSAGAANAAGTVGTANALAGGATNYLNYTTQQDQLAAYNARTAAGRSSYGA